MSFLVVAVSLATLKARPTGVVFHYTVFVDGKDAGYSDYREDPIGVISAKASFKVGAYPVSDDLEATFAGSRLSKSKCDLVKLGHTMTIKFSNGTQDVTNGSFSGTTTIPPIRSYAAAYIVPFWKSSLTYANALMAQRPNPNGVSITPYYIDGGGTLATALKPAPDKSVVVHGVTMTAHVMTLNSVNEIDYLTDGTIVGVTLPENIVFVLDGWKGLFTFLN